MVSRVVVVGALLMACAAAGPLWAQEGSVTLTAHGGGFNTAAELDDVTSSRFAGGYNYGVGVRVPVAERFGLRGGVSMARSELLSLGQGTGADLSRLFLDLAAEYRYPTESGADVYGFAGAGLVRLEEAEGNGSATKPAGVIGMGLTYPVGESGLGFFLETKGWIYRFGGLDGRFSDFEKTELELGWGGGLSFTF